MIIVRRHLKNKILNVQLNILTFVYVRCLNYLSVFFLSINVCQYNYFNAALYIFP